MQEEEDGLDVDWASVEEFPLDGYEGSVEDGCYYVTHPELPEGMHLESGPYNIPVYLKIGRGSKSLI